MIVLGLDQAPKNIGYAYGEPGAVPVRGLWQPPDYGENTARLGRAVRDWAAQLGKSVGAERIYFEQIVVRKTGLHLPTLYKQFTLVTAIEAAAEQLGLSDDVFMISIGEWRTEFYAGRRPTRGDPDGEGAAWKDMALAECLRRGWLTEDHNIAEACGIWVYGCCHSDRGYRAQHRVSARRAELSRWKEEKL
jgi:hypothetical protein